MKVDFDNVYMKRVVERAPETVSVKVRLDEFHEECMCSDDKRCGAVVKGQRCDIGSYGAQLFSLAHLGYLNLGSSYFCSAGARLL